MQRKKWLLIVLLMATAQVYAAPCKHDDDSMVTGINECLIIRTYGRNAITPPEILLIWLHGDVSAGGPATYHFKSAEQAADDFKSEKIISIAMVRPGYDAGPSESSSGNSYNRVDNYTAENMAEIGGAIKHLKQRFQVKKVILIGHSGGAASSANLLGMQANLAQAAVLVSCPCDLVSWRATRRPWRRSENPTRWLEQIDLSDHIIAITGSDDDNTPTVLAQTYIDKLKSRGIDADFRIVPGADHNSAFRSSAVHDALVTLVQKLMAE